MRKPFLCFALFFYLDYIIIHHFTYVVSHLMKIETIINTPLRLPLDQQTVA
jgi:hypothetical protein